MPKLDRSAQILAEAIGGLEEYYPCLHDGAFVAKVKSAVVVSDTGNDQLDYEKTRDRVENLCSKHEDDEFSKHLVLTVFDDECGRSAARSGCSMDRAIDPKNETPGAQVARHGYRDEMKNMGLFRISISLLPADESIAFSTTVKVRVEQQSHRGETSLILLSEFRAARIAPGDEIFQPLKGHQTFQGIHNFKGLHEAVRNAIRTYFDGMTRQNHVQWQSPEAAVIGLE